MRGRQDLKQEKSIALPLAISIIAISFDSFCKDVLSTIFNIKYVPLMDYRTYYAYRMEKREEFNRIQMKDWGF